MGISPRQYEQMKRAGGSEPALGAGGGRAASTYGIVILGIDPSLRGTGFGVIRTARTHPETLGQGTIRCPKEWEHSRCLLQIAITLREVIREHAPDFCAIEGLFHAQNLKTAIVMGQARGAAMVAAAEAGLEIFEIAPRKVKQAIVGYGAAQKLAVARMVQRMLHLKELPAPDAADALALALAHALEMRGAALNPPRKI